MKWVELVITEVNLEEIWQQPELQSSLWCDPWSKDSNEKGWDVSQFYLCIQMQTSWTKLVSVKWTMGRGGPEGTREWYLIYILWGSWTQVSVYCVCSVGRIIQSYLQTPWSTVSSLTLEFLKWQLPQSSQDVISDRNTFWSLDRKIPGLITAAFLAGYVSNKAGIQ